MQISKKRVFLPRVETKLRREDFRRVDELAKLEKKTKAEVVRDAVLWYLDHVEEIRNEPRETAVALSIKEMTNRICAMLARQGRQVGTLWELTYAMQSRTTEGKNAFDAAANTAKQKMARQVEKEERELVDKMRQVLKKAGES